MKQINVAMLYKFCREQIAKGNGNKNIVISDDVEGNGYHGLYYAFTDIDKYTQDIIYESETTSSNDTIILG